MAEATKVEEGWMVAAFSSWGLSGGGSGEPLLKEEEDKEDIDNDNEADYKKNLILSNEAEEVLDESAKYLVSSAFGAFDDASKYVSDAVAQIDEAGGKKDICAYDVFFFIFLFVKIVSNFLLNRCC